MNLEDLRQDYTQAGLSESDLTDNPFLLFEKWFRQAQSAELIEPNAMVLATADSAGKVRTRNVLLKAFDEEGFVFYTNYKSEKARQIENNPQVSLQFSWLGLERQIRIGGVAEKVSTATSLKYFLSRPRNSQLGAWVSAQSAVISSRSILEMKWQEMNNKFKEGKIPLPDFWGGYRVRPLEIEFWQGRPSRLHDRFLYEREKVNASAWTISRLSP